MKKFLWNNQELHDACPSAKLYGDCKGNRVCIDSRDVQKGDIFVALKGNNLDGHAYVVEALKNGACCAIVEYQPENMAGKNNLMIVPDAKIALKELAVFNRNRSKAKIFAITGSVGKTSTKEALHIACLSAGKSYCSRKNFNNDLGLPISLASMPIDTEYGIFELGMNHKGEIAELTKMLRPQFALITKIAPAHIGQLKSLKNIAFAKGEIFLGMNKDAVAILNGDDEYCYILEELAFKQAVTNVKHFGENSKNDSCLIKYEANTGNGASKIKAKILGDEIVYTIKARGKHQAINSIAVLTAVKTLNIDLKLAVTALENFSNIEGRGEFLELKLGDKNITILDDSYNANPASVAAALKMLEELNYNKKLRRKIALLGDMAELGQYSEDAHKKMSKIFAATGIDKLITVGSLMKNMFDLSPTDRKLKHFGDYREAKKYILSLIQDGDCLLLKGGHDTKIYEIVKHLKTQKS